MPKFNYEGKVVAQVHMMKQLGWLLYIG